MTRTRSSNRVLPLALVLAIGTGGCLTPRRFPTVPGPEDGSLLGRVEGHIVLDRPVGGIVGVHLPSVEEKLLRAPGEGIGTVHSVSGPDTRGVVVFVENHGGEGFHILKSTTLEGEPETVIVEREGDALWGDDIGDHLALSPSGGRVAAVVALEKVQMKSPPALLRRGRLAVWNLADARRLSLGPDRSRDSRGGPHALDDSLAWARDGVRLIFVDLVDADVAIDLLDAADDREFAVQIRRWPRVPAVHVLNVESGGKKVLYPGWRPVVSLDGTEVILRDLSGRSRQVSVQDGSVREPRLLTGDPIAFAGPDLVLVWASPTEGTPPRYTRNNSPLVGRKPMRSLKLVELSTGRFQTVARYVDPRRRVSFGLTTWSP